MFKRIRKYKTSLEKEEIRKILNNRTTNNKMRLGLAYETSASDESFKIKSYPAGKRGIYRETHSGQLSNSIGSTEITITSKLGLAGPILVISLYILFACSILFTISANEGRGNEMYGSNVVQMLIFMFLMHVVFYLGFIQLYAHLAKKWIEKLLKLEKIQ